MSQAWLLGRRALRESWRTPEALFPTLFIPLFFLVVNTGQAGKVFPAASTDFLRGQGYGAFQLPAVRDRDRQRADRLRPARGPERAVVRRLRRAHAAHRPEVPQRRGDAVG